MILTGSRLYVFDAVCLPDESYFQIFTYANLQDDIIVSGWFHFMRAVCVFLVSCSQFGGNG